MKKPKTKLHKYRELPPMTVASLIEKLQEIEDKNMPVLRFNMRGASMEAIQVRAVVRSKGYVIKKDYKPGTEKDRIEVDGIELY